MFHSQQTHSRHHANRQSTPVDPNELSRRLKTARIKQVTSELLHRRSFFPVASPLADTMLIQAPRTQFTQSSSMTDHYQETERGRSRYRQSEAKSSQPRPQPQTYSQPTGLSFPDPDILMRKLEAYQSELSQLQQAKQRRQDTNLGGPYNTTEFESFILGTTHSSYMQTSAAMTTAMPASNSTGIDERATRAGNLPTSAVDPVSSTRRAARAQYLPPITIPARTSSKADPLAPSAPSPVIRRGSSDRERSEFGPTTSIDQRMESDAAARLHRMSFRNLHRQLHTVKSMPSVRPDTVSSAVTASDRFSNSTCGTSMTIANTDANGGYDTDATSVYSTSPVSGKSVCHSKTNSIEQIEKELNKKIEPPKPRLPHEPQEASPISISRPRTPSHTRKRSSQARLSLFPTIVPTTGSPAISRPPSLGALRAIASDHALRHSNTDPLLRTTFIDSSTQSPHFSRPTSRATSRHGTQPESQSRPGSSSHSRPGSRNTNLTLHSDIFLEQSRRRADLTRRQQQAWGSKDVVSASTHIWNHSRLLSNSSIVATLDPIISPPQSPSVFPMPPSAVPQPVRHRRGTSTSQLASPGPVQYAKNTPAGPSFSTGGTGKGSGSGSEYLAREQEKAKILRWRAEREKADFERMERARAEALAGVKELVLEEEKENRARKKKVGVFFKRWMGKMLL